MKNSHLSPLRGEESSITSATSPDVSPDEVVATHDRFAAVGPKTDSYGFIHRNISTGPPDRRFNLNDQIEVDLEVVSEEPGTAAQTDENIVLPRRLGGWQFRPLLYWLAAFFVIAGLVPAASQSDSQLPSKLVGTGAVGTAEQGWSVALSADGNTAIVGGIVDNRLTGAAWVFTRSGGVWTQQGSKLVGTGAVGTRRTRLLRRAVRRRQHRHRGRAVRQLGRRGGVGLHPQRRCLDPAGQQAGRHRRGRKRRARRLRRAVRRRQHRHRGRA